MTALEELATAGVPRGDGESWGELVARRRATGESLRGTHDAE